MSLLSTNWASWPVFQPSPYTVKVKIVPAYFNVSDEDLSRVTVLVETDRTRNDATRLGVFRWILPLKNKTIETLIRIVLEKRQNIQETIWGSLAMEFFGDMGDRGKKKREGQQYIAGR